MNIIQLQDRLKGFSQDQLVQEMQKPSGQVPQFLVLSELQRRKRMQEEFSSQQAKEPTTVAQDAVSAAGMPQAGVANAAAAMAPKTDMANNTGIASVAPQAMRRGGAVKRMFDGGSVSAMTDPAIIAMANRMGMTVEQYLASMPPEQAAQIEAQAKSRDTRDRMRAMEPVGDGMTFPTQSDLDRRYMDQTYGINTQQFQPAPIEAPPTMPSAGAAPVLPQGLPAALPGARSAGVPVDPYAPVASALEMAQIEYDRGSAGVNPRLYEAPAVPRASGPQYEEGTIFDPMTGAPITGGGVPGEVAGPSTGSFLQDLIQSEETKKAVQALRDRQAAASETAGAGPAGMPVPEATPPAAPPAAPPVAQPPSGTGGAGGAGGAGGVGGAGAPSSFESEILSMLKTKERAAEQDKWLSLAQFGLQLMASDKPTLGGAIGEAGMAAIPAFTSSRDKAAEERLKLLGALEQARMARTRAAGMGAASGAPSAKAMPAGVITALYTQLADVNAQLSMLPPVAPGEEDPDAVLRLQLKGAADKLQQQINLGMSQYGTPYAGAAAAAPAAAYDFDATQPG